MVARTYYPDRESTFADTSCDCADRLHGHSLDDIHRIARIAVSTKTYLAIGRDLMNEAAHDGIVDALVESVGCPPFHRLLQAGQIGIQDLRDDHRHHHGRTGNGFGTAARFAALWTPWVRGDHSAGCPQDAVVERLAAEQVRQSLADEDRYVLTAVAACRGDLHAAHAVAGGGSFSRFTGRVRDARNAYLAAWFDHETPPTRGRKKPVLRRDRNRPPCGSPGGYNAHRYRREQPCDDCREAIDAYNRGERPYRTSAA